MRVIDRLLRMSVPDLRKRFVASPRAVPEGLVEALERDPREGARVLAAAIRKRRLANRREGQRLQRLLRFESELWREGVDRVAGVDEAGIAPLAGPVVAAAVILPKRYKLRGLDDSKKILDEERRAELARRIKQDALGWAVGLAETVEIDALNIYHAGLLAMRRAVEGLAPAPQFILVDARRIPHCAIPQRGIVRGDALSASIAAASILAKTTRDAHMRELDRLYPGYGFAAHKGYPTPEHCRLLAALGPSVVHRRSFGPVRQLLGLDPIQGELFARGADAPGRDRAASGTGARRPAASGSLTRD